MNTIFLGQLYLIDSDDKRADIFKEKLLGVNKAIFFTHFRSVKEAFNLALSNDIIAPDLIYLHVSLADFDAKEVLKKLRKLNKTKIAKVIVYGHNIPEAIITASVKYNFDVIKTYPSEEPHYCELFNTIPIGFGNRLLCSQECKCC